MKYSHDFSFIHIKSIKIVKSMKINKNSTIKTSTSHSPIFSFNLIFTVLSYGFSRSSYHYFYVNAKKLMPNGANLLQLGDAAPRTVVLLKHALLAYANAVDTFDFTRTKMMTPRLLLIRIFMILRLSNSSLPQECF